MYEVADHTLRAISNATPLLATYPAAYDRPEIDMRLWTKAEKLSIAGE